MARNLKIRIFERIIQAVISGCNLMISGKIEMIPWATRVEGFPVEDNALGQRDNWNAVEGGSAEK